MIDPTPEIEVTAPESIAASGLPTGQPADAKGKLWQQAVQAKGPVQTIILWSVIGVTLIMLVLAGLAAAGALSTSVLVIFGTTLTFVCALIVLAAVGYASRELLKR